MERNPIMGNHISYPSEEESNMKLKIKFKIMPNLPLKKADESTKVSICLPGLF